MSTWPKYNPERHVAWTTTPSGEWLDCGAANCGPCSEFFPCRCCEAARADEAEATLERVRDAVSEYRSMISDPGVAVILRALDGAE